jgi:hypothetical protein
MRELYAAQLGGMLAAAAATEEIARISIQIRTVPDDGAQRAAWVADHRSPHAPYVVVEASDQLESLMASTGIRHEVFVTVAVVMAQEAVAPDWPGPRPYRVVGRRPHRPPLGLVAGQVSNVRPQGAQVTWWVEPPRTAAVDQVA